MGLAEIIATVSFVLDTARAMSRENVEVVRKPFRVRQRSSRTLDERRGHAQALEAAGLEE